MQGFLSSMAGRRPLDGRPRWLGVCASPAATRFARGASGHRKGVAHNEIDIDAPPQAVFAVLSDPRSFARWVVGSRAIRSADEDWPAPGTAFDHTVGIGPVALSDHTRVLESDPPSLLAMLVYARPLSKAYVTLRLAARGGAGARVSMDEHAADLRTRLLFNALTDPLVRLRNHQSLRRLKALAEGAEPVPQGPLPAREDEGEGEVSAGSMPA